MKQPKTRNDCNGRMKDAEKLSKGPASEPAQRVLHQRSLPWTQWTRGRSCGSLLPSLWLGHEAVSTLPFTQRFLAMQHYRNLDVGTGHACAESLVSRPFSRNNADADKLRNQERLQKCNNASLACMCFGSVDYHCLISPSLGQMTRCRPTTLGWQAAHRVSKAITCTSAWPTLAWSLSPRKEVQDLGPA